MQADLHYYVTFIAARAAGWSHEDAAEIALAAHYVDCSGDPDSLKAPWQLAKTLQRTITCVEQLWQAKENMRTMPPDNQLVWSAFHFLPGFDPNPKARYDYVYDDRPWDKMSGNGTNRREPLAVARSGWVYTQAVKSNGSFATPREWKLAMRCFPNSRTIAAMTADTATQLDMLFLIRQELYRTATGAGGHGEKFAARYKAREARSRALGLIGVRLHVLADSFSHAGFAGTTSSINKEDGSWLLIDPTRNDQPAVEINYALGSHGVAKWMATGHAMAGALPDMPGARYCFQSPKLDVRIYKDNPIAYKYAIIAVRQFLAEMRPHVADRLAALEEPDQVRDFAGLADRAEQEEQAAFVALFDTLVGDHRGPLFLTDPDFQFPHASDRSTGFAGRHPTSWFWGSNMWEYNAEKADNSLELRSRNLHARITRLMQSPNRKFHTLCEMWKIGSAGELAFQQKESKAGLRGTYISNKNTEYSIIRRVRVRYFEQSETAPKWACLQAANWAAEHHITWFDHQYGPAIRRELARPNAHD